MSVGLLRSAQSRRASVTSRPPVLSVLLRRPRSVPSRQLCIVHRKKTHREITNLIRISFKKSRIPIRSRLRNKKTIRFDYCELDGRLLHVLHSSPGIKWISLKFEFCTLASFRLQCRWPEEIFLDLILPFEIGSPSSDHHLSECSSRSIVNKAKTKFDLDTSYILWTR